jgi:hypothetical protein
LETKMGEIIAFRAMKDDAHPRPPLEGPAEIVTFTGGWHAPMNDQDGQSRPGFEKAAWYKRCRSKLSCSIGLLWPWITAALRGDRNRPGAAVHVTTPEHHMIPGEAKRGGVSS